MPAGGSISREEPVELHDRLKALAWNISEPARAIAAADQIEGRYGSSSEKSTDDVLVADLNAPGIGKITTKFKSRAVQAASAIALRAPAEATAPCYATATCSLGW